MKERFDENTEIWSRKQGFVDNHQVDNPLILPYGVLSRLFITRADVIHRFCVLGLGVKIDAVPGRLNRILVQLLFPGVFSGGCAELCGEHHAHMPIRVESVGSGSYLGWLRAVLGYALSSRLAEARVVVEGDTTTLIGGGDSDKSRAEILMD